MQGVAGLLRGAILGKHAPAPPDSTTMHPTTICAIHIDPSPLEGAFHSLSMYELYGAMRMLFAWRAGVSTVPWNLLYSLDTTNQSAGVPPPLAPSVLLQRSVLLRPFRGPFDTPLSASSHPDISTLPILLISRYSLPPITCTATWG